MILPGKPWVLGHLCWSRGGHHHALALADGALALWADHGLRDLENFFAPAVTTIVVDHVRCPSNLLNIENSSKNMKTSFATDGNLKAWRNCRQLETSEACGGFRLHWLAQPVPLGIWLGGRPCAPLSYAQKDLDSWELASRCCQCCIHHFRYFLSSSSLVMFGTTKL